MLRMALTSGSTPDEIVAAYKDNADYDTAGSKTKAAGLIQACRFMLIEPTPMSARTHAMATGAVDPTMRSCSTL